MFEAISKFQKLRQQGEKNFSTRWDYSLSSSAGAASSAVVSSSAGASTSAVGASSTFSAAFLPRRGAAAAAACSIQGTHGTDGGLQKLYTNPILTGLNNNSAVRDGDHAAIHTANGSDPVALLQGARRRRRRRGQALSDGAAMVHHVADVDDVYRCDRSRGRRSVQHPPFVQLTSNVRAGIAQTTVVQQQQEKAKC